MRGQLKRDLRKEELTRIEEAARTEKDFEKLEKEWAKWDSNRRRRERRYEIKLGSLIEQIVEIGDSGAVIPQPLDHRHWRQMMQGNFLDVIFDCPYDIHELTSSRNISELVDALNDNQKEILYLRAIRQWSPQKIAAMRGQTDRNIRKVYDTLIESLRRKLYNRLLYRYERKLPLTLAQQEFMAAYNPKVKAKNNPLT